MRIAANGNVGIGTSVPTQKLDVNGQIRMQTGASAGFVPVSDANGTMTWTDPATIGSADDGDWIVAGNDQYSAVSGNVGIGTTTPVSGLHIAKTDGIQLNVAQGSGAVGGLYFRDGYRNSNNRHYHLGITSYDHSSNGTGFSDGLVISGYDGIGFTTGNTTTSTLANVRMFIAQNGRVGIGTNTPDEKLDVNGQIRMQTGAGAGFIPVSDANGTMTWTDPATIGSADDGDWIVAGNDQYSAVPGNVGIGITSTTHKFEVQDGVNPMLNSTTVDISELQMKVRNSNAGNGQGAGLGFATGGPNLMGAAIVHERTGTNSNGKLHFATKNDGANGADLPIRMTINGTGNVGIGTTDPQDEFHVVGSIRMDDGNQTAGFIPVSDANGTMTWTDPATISAADDGDWTIIGNNQYSAVSGNVGIGTTSPNARLDVIGNNAGSTSLTLRSGDNWNSYDSNQITFAYGGSQNHRHAIKTRHYAIDKQYNAFDFYLWDQGTDAAGDVATKRVMTIDGRDQGMVGIGESVPRSELHISDGSPSLKTVNDGGGFGASILITDNAAPRIYFEEQGQAADNKLMDISLQNQTLSIGSLNDGGGAWDNQYILSAHRDGNVGIGTPSPDEKLSVIGIVRGAQASNEAEYTEIGHGGTHGYINTVGDGRLEFRHDSNTMMALQDNGYFGIGTTTPDYKLQVDGDVVPEADATYDLGTSSLKWNNVYASNLNVDGLTQGSVVFAGTSGAIAEDNANFFWDDATNRLGIGTVTPDVRLDVNGKVKISGGDPANGKVLTSTDAGGNAVWASPTANVDFSKSTGVLDHDATNGYVDVAGPAYLSVITGDIVTVQAVASLRLTGGDNTDDFFYRVRTIGCATTDLNEVLYRPDEGGSDHDNFVPVPYLDYWVSTCTGGMFFYLEVKNTGNDAWQAQDRVLIVRKN